MDRTGHFGCGAMPPNRAGGTPLRRGQVSISVFVGSVIAACQTLPSGTEVVVVGRVVAEAALGELPFFWTRVVAPERTDEGIDLIPLAVLEVVRRPILAVGSD